MIGPQTHGKRLKQKDNFRVFHRLVTYMKLKTGLSDFAIIAVNWLHCSDPDSAEYNDMRCFFQFNCKDNFMKYFVVLVCLLSNITFSYADIVRASNRDALTVPPITNSHPRLWLSNERLEFLCKAYRQKQQPYYDVLGKMVNIAESNLSAETNAYTGKDLREWMVNGYGDGKTAVCTAIAYFVTGKDQYKKKAAELILLRTKFNNSLGNVNLSEAPFPNIGLYTVAGSSGLIYAYDLMAATDAFSSKEKRSIEKWISGLTPIIKEAITRWDTPYKAVSKETNSSGWVQTNDERDRYFSSQLYQNHPGTHLMGIVMIGYVLGDRDLVQYGLDSSENPRDLKNMIDGAIHIEGDTNFVRFELPRVLEVGKNYGLDLSLADWHIAAPQTGEIYDRYRTISSHGFGYSKHGFKMLLLCAEIAYQNGIDFYHYTGTDGENLLLPFVFYKDFIINCDNSLKGGYYIWSPMNEKVASDFAEIYELGLKRYPKHKDMFLSVLKCDYYNRTDASLYPVHNPVLNWFISFGVEY